MNCTCGSVTSRRTALAPRAQLSKSDPMTAFSIFFVLMGTMDAHERVLQLQPPLCPTTARLPKPPLPQALCLARKAAGRGGHQSQACHHCQSWPRTSSLRRQCFGAPNVIAAAFRTSSSSVGRKLTSTLMNDLSAGVRQKGYNHSRRANRLC